MAESCNIWARRKNSKTGELTNRISSLHSDLLSLEELNSNWDRKEANKALLLSQNESFRKEYADELMYDSDDPDADVTIVSLYEIAPEQTGLDEKTVLAFLNKKFESGDYNYDDAIVRVNSFNSEGRGGQTFMATLRENSDGTYHTEIVPNTKNNQDKLIDALSEAEAAQVILDILEQRYGVTAVAGLRNRYSTEGPIPIVNGMRGLMEIKGGKHKLHELSMETGHFIIGSLEDSNPLYQRLSTLIRQYPDIIKAILGETEANKYYRGGVLTQKYFREMLGHIVGKYLEDNLKEIFYPNPTILDNIKRLLQKIKDFVKDRFAFTDSEYKNVLHDAKYAANKLAKNFLQESFQGSLENALKTKETLEYSDQDVSETRKGIKSLIEEVKLFVKDIKGYLPDSSVDNYKNFIDSMASAYVSLRRKDPNIFDLTDERIQVTIGENIYDLVNSLYDNIDQCLDDLKEAQRLLDMRSLLSKDLSALKKAAQVCQRAVLLEQMYSDIQGKMAYFADTTEIKAASKKLEEINEKITRGFSIVNANGEAIFNTMRSGVNEVRKKMSYHLISSLNGSSIFNAGSYIENDGLFKLKRHGFGHLKGEALRKKILEMQDANQEDLSLIDLYSDLSKTYIRRKAEWWSTAIGAMIDNPDIINQYLSVAVDNERHRANKAHLEVKGKLMEWYRYLRANNISMSEFFELESTGKVSGNIVSALNWGDWEREWEVSYQEFKDDYFDNHKRTATNPQGYTSLEDMYNDAEYMLAKDNFKRDWHRENSFLVELTDKDGTIKTDDSGKPIKVYRPASIYDVASIAINHYDNEKFNHRYNYDLEFKHAYDEYMKIKRDLDDLIPIGSTNYFGVRAPQFENTTIGRIKNNFPENSKKIGRFIGRSSRSIMNTLVLVSPEELEFGVDGSAGDDVELITRDDEENSRHIFERKIESNVGRLPIYGVRKFNKHLKERGVLNSAETGYYDRSQNLSMDLVQSTLAYSAMANSYSCLDNIADIAVQLAARLNPKEQQREAYDIIKGGKLKSYDRLENYVKQQIFNNYESVDIKDLQSKDGFIKSSRKTLSKISVGASYYFLGWNFPSAMTNLHTGLNELMHEAISGENFTKRDLIFATATYVAMTAKHFISNFFNLDNKTVGTLFDKGLGSNNEGVDKASVFLKYFDAQNDLMRDSMNSFIDTPGYQRFKRYSYAEISMIPYTWADGIMQSLAYFATAHHVKLRDKKTNKEIRLYDAYKVKKVTSIADGKERNSYTLEIDYSRYEIFSERKDRNIKLYNKLKEEKEGGTRVYSLIEKAVTVKDETGETRVDLNPYTPWTEEEENLFRLRCRGINNRLHGIYNRSDGGAYMGMLIGPLLAMLKKYAIGLIDQRFSRIRHDVRIHGTRGGTYGSIATLIKDNFSTFKSEDYEYKKTFGLSQKLDDLEYTNLLTSIVKIIYGLYKTTYMITSAPINYALDDYMEARGFSKNAISNIRRFWSYIVIPSMLHFIRTTFLMPPEEEEQEQGRLSSWISDKLMDIYVWSLKSMPGKMTVDDYELLNAEVLNNEVSKKSNVPAFSIKGILAYQLYRAEMEQLAYLAPRRMFAEYEHLSGTSLSQLSALREIIDTLLGFIPKSSKQVEKMAEQKKTDQQKKNTTESYSKPINDERSEVIRGEGWKTRIRAPHKDWYVPALTTYKHLAFRTLEVYWNPYVSMENYEYYLNTVLKGGGK